MNLNLRRLPFREEEQGAPGVRFCHRVFARNRLVGRAAIPRQQRVGLTQVAKGPPPGPGRWLKPLRVEVIVAGPLVAVVGASDIVAGTLGAAAKERCC